MICSFPLFWWAMWANRSGGSPKMSDVSKWLRSLTKNERPWAIRSGAHFFAKNERFAQKTRERIPSPVHPPHWGGAGITVQYCINGGVTWGTLPPGLVSVQSFSRTYRSSFPGPDWNKTGFKGIVAAMGHLVPRHGVLRAGAPRDNCCDNLTAFKSRKLSHCRK